MEKWNLDDFLEIFANDVMNMPSPIWDEKQNKGQTTKSIDDRHSIAKENTTVDLSSIFFDPSFKIDGIKLRKTTDVNPTIQIPETPAVDISDDLFLFCDDKIYSTIIQSSRTNAREEDHFASSGVQEEEDDISAIITAKRKDLEVPWVTMKKPVTDHQYHGPYNFSGTNFQWEKMTPYKPNCDSIERVKEIIYQAAVMRPVNLGPEKPIEKPRRKNVKISNDPQTVAARIRRERIGNRLRVLQRLVPGGTNMDTASMLDEACSYIKYLKSQLTLMGNNKNSVSVLHFLHL